MATRGPAARGLPAAGRGHHRGRGRRHPQPSGWTATGPSRRRAEALLDVGAPAGRVRPHSASARSTSPRAPASAARRTSSALSPIELKVSQEVRLERLVKDAVYKDETRQLQLPVRKPSELVEGLLVVLRQLVPARRRRRATSPLTSSPREASPPLSSSVAARVRGRLCTEARHRRRHGQRHPGADAGRRGRARRHQRQPGLPEPARRPVQAAGQTVEGADAGTFDANFVTPSCAARCSSRSCTTRSRGAAAADDDCKAAAQKTTAARSLGQNDPAGRTGDLRQFPADYQTQLRAGTTTSSCSKQTSSASRAVVPRRQAYFDAHQDDFARSASVVIGVNDETLANSIVHAGPRRWRLRRPGHGELHGRTTAAERWRRRLPCLDRVPVRPSRRSCRARQSAR